MIDAYSDTWRDVATKLKELIEQARGKLEQPDLQMADTQFMRGRISAAREMLALVQKRQPIDPARPVELRPRDRSGI